MNAENLALALEFVSKSYVELGAQALAKREKLIKSLLSQRRLPRLGWDEATIEIFIRDVSLMDSNNFVGSVGVGEREGRVASGLVARRHYGLAHGIGRSGDLTAEQPKAAGSSLLAKLSNVLVLDAMQIAGLKEVTAVTVLPCATGMAITLSLLALKASRPVTARYVLWPRLDQKTCIKAIVSAGCEAVPLPLVQEGDELRTNLPLMEQEIERLGPENIVCVLSSTSCFAPRGADRCVEIAKLCASTGIPHLINNAYGVQSAALCALVTSAMRKGRVDGIVQSTDKNFMVPVGGAVIAAGRGRPDLVRLVNEAYPGRASVGPSLDVLMTLLGWGAEGWRNILAQREDVYIYAKSRLADLAARHNERVLETPSNPISLAMTLCTLGCPEPPQKSWGPSPSAADQGDALNPRQGEKANARPAAIREEANSARPLSPEGGRVPGKLPGSTQTLTRGGSAQALMRGGRAQTLMRGEITQTLLRDGASEGSGGTSSPPRPSLLSALCLQRPPSLRKESPAERETLPTPSAAAAPATAAATEDRGAGGAAWGDERESLLSPGTLTFPRNRQRAQSLGDLARATCPPALGPQAADALSPRHATGAAQLRAAQGAHTAAEAALARPSMSVITSEYPVTFIGSMLFSRGVSGTRVVPTGKTATVAGHKFIGYGAHCDHYPTSYLSMGAALGTTRDDIDVFIARLQKCLCELNGGIPDKGRKAK